MDNNNIPHVLYFIIDTIERSIIAIHKRFENFLLFIF